MSWCDKLASTPSVGIWFSEHYLSSARVLDSLSPILDELVVDGKAKFSLAKQDAFALEVSCEDGFQYSVNASQISVSFGHRLKVRQVSGGPPTVDMLSQPKPYTALLPDTCAKLLRVTSHVVDLKTRMLQRMGIVSTTIVSDEELPPGIKRLINYAGRPWKNGLKYFDIQLVSTLAETSGYSDRCTHHITKSENSEEELITVRFDWQRKYIEGRHVTQESLRAELEACQTSSLKYFEELAIGDMFDEDLINTK